MMDYLRFLLVMKKRLDDRRELLLEDGVEDHDDNEEAEHRWGQRSLIGFNQWPHVFNLTNCIVGVSVLAMPYCLQQCGILLGTVLIGVCSLLSKITCHLLYKSAVITRRRDYWTVALYAFGNPGRRLVLIMLLMYLMSSIISFMVVIGDVGPHVLADYLELQAPTQRLRVLVMVFVFLFVILPLALIRNLDSLSLVSSMTVVFYFIFVIRMLVECTPRILEGKWSQDVHWWRQEGILTSLPIISMALSCQTQLFSVAECIRDPEPAKVDTIVSGAVNICSAIYAAVGLFGYVAFHDIELHGDVLLYLQSSWITQTLKLAFMLSIAFSVPLMLFPTREACFSLFLRPNVGEFTVTQMSKTTFVMLTFVLLLIDLVTAVVVPNVEFILGLTGALVGSVIAIIIPSALFIRVSPRTKSNTSLLLYAKISLVVGAVMLVCSTWAVLGTDRRSDLVDIILPKQFADEAKAEDSLKIPEGLKLENIDILARFNETLQNKAPDEADLGNIKKKEEEIGEEARKILAEMKEQRKEQDEMIKEQQAIVRELNKQHELHIQEEKKVADAAKRDVGSAEQRDAVANETKTSEEPKPAEPVIEKEVQNVAEDAEHRRVERAAENKSEQQSVTAEPMPQSVSDAVPGEACEKTAGDDTRGSAESQPERPPAQQPSGESVQQPSEPAQQHTEEEAKRLAEEQAKQQEAEQAKRQAEEQAKQQAAEQAKRQAEEQAKQQAAEQAKRQAEEQARLAEEQAKQQAAEQAKRQAEEQAKQQAAEQAKRQAEEQAKQAEEQAKQQAAEEAKRQAEEKAKQQAAEEARRQAEEQAKRQAEEQAKLAEEQAKQQAAEEAKRQAEEKAKEQAAEQAKQQAAEQAKQQAEEQAKRQAEEQAKLAEEQAKQRAADEAKRQAEEQAKQQAEEQAKQQAEEQAKRQEAEQAKQQAAEQAKQQAAQEPGGDAAHPQS